LIVYVTRYLGKWPRFSKTRHDLIEGVDLLWTAFDPDSLYNTVLKIAYIGSSSYIIYLMLNDYKSTHDPNIDTFKVEYLLSASAVLAVFAPNRFTHTPTEVCWQD
jgi:ER lumen protein retaining receptor